MLPEYLTVVYERETKKASERELTNALKKLSNEELFALANGTVSEDAKHAFATHEDWLSKYEGSELFERAVLLEQALLRVELQEQQRREAQKSIRQDDLWDARDRICLQKRMLDLELAQLREARLRGAESAPPSSNLGTELAPSGDPGAPPERPPTSLADKQAALDIAVAGGLGARKATRGGHDEPVEGAVRGAGGYMLGSVPGAIMGGAAAGSLRMTPPAALLPIAAGALTGGALGYRALTRKYDAPPSKKPASGGAPDAKTSAMIDVARELARADVAHSKIAGAMKTSGFGAMLGAGGTLVGRAGALASRALPGVGSKIQGAAPALGSAATRVGTAVNHGGALGGLKALGRMGANVARKNPLLAAGVAGGAGLALGKSTD